MRSEGQIKAVILINIPQSLEMFSCIEDPTLSDYMICKTLKEINKEHHVNYIRESYAPDPFLKGCSWIADYDIVDEGNPPVYFKNIWSLEDNS